MAKTAAERSPVRVLIDTDRVHYATWGLGRTNLTHFAGRRSLGEVARLARQGIRNRHPDGTRWQGAGTFAVDEVRNSSRFFSSQISPACAIAGE